MTTPDASADPSLDPAADPSADPFELLGGAKRERAARILAGMSSEDLAELDAEWQMWAHGGRRPPPRPWSTWVMMAGRGFGKTRTGAEWIDGLARRDGSLRIALVGASLSEARSVMVEGTSGILAVAAEADAGGVESGSGGGGGAGRGGTGRGSGGLRWMRTDGRLSWPSGAEAKLFSGAAPELLRGPEHHHAWCDELAKWARPDDTWNNLRLGLRGGASPSVLVTTTPRPLPLLHRILAEPGTVRTGGRTTDNPYLHADVRAALVVAYAGTRLGRQELDGELLLDLQGALWPRALIEACRVRADGVPALTRVVVGVDPPGGSGPDADACGIVAVGVGPPDPVTGQTIGYVLDDASVRGERPDGWARAVVAAYHRWNASRVVAETNQGGEMVESVLRAVEAGLSLRPVHASRGKAARAEPVAALYETGRVFHAGRFPALEDEMAGMMVGGYEGAGGSAGKSPDRADALVWALTELMLGKSAAEPRLRRL